jgi:hypothetical protein
MAEKIASEAELQVKWLHGGWSRHERGSPALEAGCLRELVKRFKEPVKLHRSRL